MSFFAKVMPFAAVIFVLFPVPVQAAGIGRDTARARAIMTRVDDLWRAESSHGVMVMRVVTAHYQRNLKLEEWSRGRDESLVRILYPPRENGTATLKSGNTVYTWLPRTDRVIRLTSSTMMATWMGSHFTNDDLVKASRLADDYDPGIVFTGVRHGIDLIEIALRPRPDAAVVWDRILVEVDRSRTLPLVCRYYDEDGQLVRSLFFSGVKMMDNRLLPTVMRMVPADKPGEFTEIRYQSLEFGLVFADSFFSVNQLRRR